jgi:hypothetical protein
VGIVGVDHDPYANGGAEDGKGKQQASESVHLGFLSL